MRPTSRIVAGVASEEPPNLRTRIASRRRSRIRNSRFQIPDYLMVTPTCAFDQQHWKPPPPTPVLSLPSTRKMSSPGALNVALLTVLPSAARSIDGLLLSNLTSPGPRNFVHVSAIAGGGVKPAGAAPRAAPRPPAAAPVAPVAPVAAVASVAPVAPGAPA